MCSRSERRGLRTSTTRPVHTPKVAPAKAGANRDAYTNLPAARSHPPVIPAKAGTHRAISPQAQTVCIEFPLACTGMPQMRRGPDSFLIVCFWCSHDRVVMTEMLAGAVTPSALSYTPQSMPPQPQCRHRTNPHFPLSYTPVTSYARARSRTRLHVKFGKFTHKSWVQGTDSPAGCRAEPCPPEANPTWPAPPHPPQAPVSSARTAPARSWPRARGRRPAGSR